MLGYQHSRHPGTQQRWWWARPGIAEARGGTTTILYWPVPTTFNSRRSLGTKAPIARVVYEPIAAYGPDDTLVPFLAWSVFSIENDLLASDGISFTWKLMQGVEWSDG